MRANTFGAVCGPPVMYRFVIDEMRKKGISYDRIYVSFERHMKCGMGKCGALPDRAPVRAASTGPCSTIGKRRTSRGRCSMGGLNMSGRCIACEEKPAPRVVVVGLASCFGCQLQITNVESHLLDVLGQIDLRYWQLRLERPDARGLRRRRHRRRRDHRGGRRPGARRCARGRPMRHRHRRVRHDGRHPRHGLRRASCRAPVARCTGKARCPRPAAR